MRRACLFAVLFAVGCVGTKAPDKEGDGKAKLPRRGEVAATLNAADLHSQYEVNPTKADAVYKGKTIIVKTTIMKVGTRDGKPFAGTARMAEWAPGPSSSEREKKWYSEGYPMNIIYYLDPAEADGVDVQPSNQVAVVGVCQGRADDPDVYKGFIVTLENCILAK